MGRPKQRLGDAEETEFLFDSDFDAADFIEGVEGQDGRRSRVRQQRPARQRVELRIEEKWLRQQLSDWDDFARDYTTADEQE